MKHSITYKILDYKLKNNHYFGLTISYGF